MMNVKKSAAETTMTSRHFWKTDCNSFDKLEEVSRTRIVEKR